MILRTKKMNKNYCKKFSIRCGWKFWCMQQCMGKVIRILYSEFQKVFWNWNVHMIKLECCSRGALCKHCKMKFSFQQKLFSSYPHEIQELKMFLIFFFYVFSYSTVNIFHIKFSYYTREKYVKWILLKNRIWLAMEKFF